jgi:hypothetical protein
MLEDTVKYCVNVGLVQKSSKVTQVNGASLMNLASVLYVNGHIDDNKCPSYWLYRLLTICHVNFNILTLVEVVNIA